MSAFAALVVTVLPSFASAYVEYGAYYTTPAPYYQQYYQPMYAYSWSPAQSSSNHSYQPQYYGAPQYSYPQYNSYSQNYYPQQYTAPQYNYYPQQTYSQPVPYSYGYPTGDSVPWIGGQLCDFPDYNGRAACGSNPNQWIYDPWTGSWY